MKRLMWRRHLVTLAIMCGCIALVPILDSSNFVLTVGATAFIFAILALSFDILWGMSGILHLAPALSFGIGAYLWPIAGKYLPVGASTFTNFAICAAGAATVAIIFSYIAFRASVQNIYFALISLAVLLAADELVSMTASVTGGSNGLLRIPAPSMSLGRLGRFSASTHLSLYLLSAGLLVSFMVIGVLLRRSRYGQIMFAIRNNELRTEALGYNSLYYKVTLSGITAAMGGVAGALYGPIVGIVDPSVLSVALSIQVFVWVAVGGVGSLIGPVLIAILLTVTQSYLAGASATVYLLVTGVVFILVVVLLPNGLASLSELPKSVYRRGRLH